MAIAFDNSINVNSYPTKYTSYTNSYTVGTGSNRILICWIGGDTDTSLITSVTYGGVAMTKLRTYSGTGAGNMDLWYLINPATGSNTFSVTTSASTYRAYFLTSYTGVNQSSFPDNEGTVQTGSGSSISATLAPIAANSWGILGVSANRTASSGTNCTLRGSGIGSNTQYGDTNAAISSSTTMTMNESSSGAVWAVMLTLAPSIAAPAYTPNPISHLIQLV